MPTPLTPTQRYIAPGTTKYYWATACADITAPLRAEMEAGIDLSKEVAAAENWTVAANRVPTPDLGDKFTGKIGGRVEPGDASITFHASKTTADVRTVLHRDDTGFIFILHGGDVAGQKMDVYKVDISSVSKPTNVDGSENARIMVAFSLQAVAEDVTIPALS